MIAVIDYGVGNIQSVLNAFEVLGAPAGIISSPADLSKAEAIVIPGVGAFRDGMANLRAAGFIEPLREEVLQKKKPFLGICLGMQLLAKKSFEFGEYEGLGWIDGTVEKITPSDPLLRVPHMGWNNLEKTRSDSVLLRGLEREAVVYFVHSYYFKPAPGAETVVTATCNHGQTLTAIVEQGTIFGAQFHPEKSQHTGLTILKNFVNFIHNHA